GFALESLRVNAEGVVPPDELERCAAFGPRLAVLMLANHETGALQPVRQLAKRAPVHCDAAAAAGKEPIDFHDLGVTTLTLSAHKFHGPQGVGALLVRRGTKLRPLLFGGHQQQARRPGTEPVALAVGLAAALHIAMRDHEQRWRRVTALRQLFLGEVERLAAPVALNGPAAGGLPHTINLSFPGVAADVLLM